MPRAKKEDKFYHYKAKKSGRRKNKILIGINNDYYGSDKATLKDFVAYLEANNISLESIILTPNNIFISELGL
ncbi:MAG: hypothetical protein WCK37_02075 [Candidatus Falkowbacteria bacterium]